MKSTIRLVLYIVMAVFMVPSFYMIFNAGNPDSLLRYVIKTTEYDLTVTIGFCMVVAVLALVLSTVKSKNSIEFLLDMNHEQIRKLRSGGKTDAFITEDFLKNLGVKNKGILQTLARRRVVRYLRKFK